MAMTEFTTKPNSRLFCPICQDVFTDPLISMACNHSFCARCITEGLRLENHCPLCRSFLTMNELHSNLILKSLADELVAYCPNRAFGCQATMTREALTSHGKSCEYALGVCVHSGLGCKFAGSGVAVGRHLSDCAYEQLMPFIVATGARISSLESLVEAQQADIAKLRKQMANATFPQSQTILDDEEEIVLPKTQSFPHGQNIECRRTISDNKAGVTSLAYTSQNILLSGSYDGSIKLFNAESGKMVRSLAAHDLTVWAIAAEESTSRFFSAGSDGKIKVWELEGENTCLKVLNDHQRKVYSLQISDGRLYSASSDGKIKIWSTESMECLSTIQAHSDCINSLVLYDRDATKMVSVSSDSTLKLWDLTTGTAIHTFSDLGSEGLDVTSGGGMLYASTFDASIVAFDMDTYTRTRTLRGHNWEVWQVKHIDGVLFSGSHDHTIRRWDLKTFASDLTLTGHKGYVHSFRFGSDCLISAGADKTIKIWK